MTALNFYNNNKNSFIPVTERTDCKNPLISRLKKVSTHTDIILNEQNHSYSVIYPFKYQKSKVTVCAVYSVCKVWNARHDGNV